MLRHILEGAIAKHAELELASDVRSLVAPPDVAIVGTTAIEDPTEATTLLTRWPRSRIVMLEISGGNAVVYELRQHKRSLGEMSAPQLIEAITAGWNGSALLSGHIP